MKIKRFKLFTEGRGSQYKYGCVMSQLNISNWETIISKIDKKDLFNPDNPSRGYETEPHITVLFGLHSEVDDYQVEKCIRSISGNFELKATGISIFENKEFDVIKIDVESDYIIKLNKELSKLPHIDEFSTYKPHITMAFVKPGIGKKYVNNNFNYKFNNITKIIYSKTDGSKSEFETK